MIEVGPVERKLVDRVASGEKLHFSLIDPDKVNDLDQVEKVATELADAGTDAFLVGGSLGVTQNDVEEVVKVLKRVGLPVILFPGSIAGIARNADAILFLSLLNSEDLYYVIGAQMSAAPIVYRLGLEAIPTAYIIVGYGGAAGFVGRARPIPLDKPEICVAYVLAAKYMGMRFIYLEAGSGAPQPVPVTMVSAAKRVAKDRVLIVGGGIRDFDTATRIAKAGADIIVTGTVIETDIERAKEIIKRLKALGR